MALGENIRAAREAKGWSQHDMTKHTGIAQSTISRYEDGLLRPRPKRLRMIAAKLGTDAATLEYGSNELNIKGVGKAKIPVLDYVQAAKWPNVDLAFGVIKVSKLADYSEYSQQAFVLIVHGTSMAPDFIEGDQVFVDPAVESFPGAFVVAVEGDGPAVFKRYASIGRGAGDHDVFELRPMNNLFPTTRSDQVKIRIVGTAVDFKRTLILRK